MNKHSELKHYIENNEYIYNLVYCGVLILDHKVKTVYCNKYMESYFASIEEIDTVLQANFLDSKLVGMENIDSIKETVWSFNEMNCYIRGKRLSIDDVVFGFLLFLTVESIDSYTEKKEKLIDELNSFKEINKELSTIIDSSYDGIWVSNGKGMTLRVNPSFEKFSGIKREELIGRSLTELVDKGYFTDSAALRVIENNAPVTLTYKTNTGKLALVTGNPIYDENGNIHRIITNVRDISLIANMQKEIDKWKSLSNWEIDKDTDFRSQNNSLEHQIIYCSKKMERALQTSEKAAKVDSNVLITGDSGVGKDLIAKHIHQLSLRSTENFVQINCGSIPETLLESELFGYIKGSFTGASSTGKVGLFEIADRGTLFLDEIGDLPFRLQVKLLQAIEHKEIYRIGSAKPIKLDVRVITATNQDLESMVKEGSFRKDLYYRLNVISIKIPSLRERKEDINALTNHFVKKFNHLLGCNKNIEPEALTNLSNYHWPGNIRELENTVESLFVLIPHDSITIFDLPYKLKHLNQQGDNSLSKKKISICIPISLKDATEAVEKILIEEALTEYKNSRQAARILHTNQSTIVRKAKKYKLQYLYGSYLYPKTDL